jgi:hypothetical protein
MPKERQKSAKNMPKIRQINKRFSDQTHKAWCTPNLVYFWSSFGIFLAFCPRVVELLYAYMGILPHSSHRSITTQEGYHASGQHASRDYVSLLSFFTNGNMGENENRVLQHKGESKNPLARSYKGEPVYCKEIIVHSVEAIPDQFQFGAQCLLM